MQFVKSILKWAFLIVFVAPQAIGMAIFVGIPLCSWRYSLLGRRCFGHMANWEEA
jgi:hypothetical protein